MLYNTEMIIYSSCVVSTAMVVWFCTDALYEYAKILGFKTFLYIDDFDKQRGIAYDLTYPEYLSIHRPSFLSKLLACPFCLCFWFSFCIPFAIYGDFFDAGLFFPIYILSLTIFFFIKKLSSE